eukprot:3585354-Amphidinium_carterae.1
MMDKMVADLKKEQQEEAEEKAFCIKEFDENEKVGIATCRNLYPALHRTCVSKATYAKNSEKEDLEAEIASLTSTIETLTKEVEVATKEVADTKCNTCLPQQQLRCLLGLGQSVHGNMREASEEREKENTEFQA